jgi:hypothetical protein
MQSKELRAMQDKLSSVHHDIHAVHRDMPGNTRTDHPVLAEAVSAACAAIASTLSAFYVLSAVLDADAAPKGA